MKGSSERAHVDLYRRRGLVMFDPVRAQVHAELHTSEWCCDALETAWLLSVVISRRGARTNLRMSRADPAVTSADFAISACVLQSLDIYVGSSYYASNIAKEREATSCKTWF